MTDEVIAIREIFTFFQAYLIMSNFSQSWFLYATKEIFECSSSMQ